MDSVMIEAAALFQVVLIDLALAGDNAVAVALAASGLPPQQRQQAIFWGIGAALMLRIAFALITVQLLAVPGLMLIGGVLLLWVATRMYNDLRAHGKDAEPSTPASEEHDFRRAITSIIVADVSMSLDNVLAVAGVARETQVVLAIGLVLSVVLMGVAAGFIARLINKYPIVGYIGVVIILIAAGQMIWDDLNHLFPVEMHNFLRVITGSSDA